VNRTATKGSARCWNGQRKSNGFVQSQRQHRRGLSVLWRPAHTPGFSMPLALPLAAPERFGTVLTKRLVRSGNVRSVRSTPVNAATKPGVL